MWEPKPGTLWATPGLLWDCFTFTFTFTFTKPTNNVSAITGMCGAVALHSEGHTPIFIISLHGYPYSYSLLPEYTYVKYVTSDSFKRNQFL